MIRAYVWFDVPLATILIGLLLIVYGSFEATDTSWRLLRCADMVSLSKAATFRDGVLLSLMFYMMLDPAAIVRVIGLLRIKSMLLIHSRFHSMLFILSDGF